MKNPYFFITLLTLLIGLTFNAQEKVRLQDLSKQFENYWDSLEYDFFEERNNAGKGGFQQFKRWEAFMRQRTFPSGTFPRPDILYNEYKRYSNLRTGGFQLSAANWSFIGPGVIPSNGGGAGRINCITLDPSNSNIIWVGAACGGLWKSIDAGLSWSCNTDLLPSLSISDIVIDPTNPLVMYLATGDKYGIYSQYQIWGHYSAGILKSTDGGLTWNPTGMTYSIDNNILIQRLIIDPSNTSTLYAATFTGIFKSIDAGLNWTNIHPGFFYDIEMHPTNNSILYIGDNTGFKRSTDAGQTWNYINGITANNRVSVAVTPANPNQVCVWAMGGGFYTSTNSGASFTLMTSPGPAATPYGHYDMVVEISPVNSNVIFCGGMEIARSTNGGVSWTTVSSMNYTAPNYAHADTKNFLFLPGSSTSLYVVNDGGIFRTTNQGSTFTDLGNGINIKQYYRFSSSFLTPGLMYAGAQDNGTDKITGITTATNVFGADGEECLIDFTNDNIVFVSYQGGNFYRSTDGGQSFSVLSEQGCDWTSPLIMDPNNNTNMYMGSDDVFRSTDNGITWINTTNGILDGTCVYSLEISSSNANYVYAATFGNIYRTTNGGSSWSNITGTLPVGNAAITGIAISGVNPDQAWVNFSGFSANDKVYMTIDGGQTWTNVSGTLPNVPANCIEFQNGSNELVYLGTDLGVFYRDGTMNDWLPYATNLPNVIIDELEVYYPTSKLRAATFGRGIWESDLQVSTIQALDASAFALVYPPSSTCDTIISPIVTIRNAGQNTITSVDLYYRMDTGPFVPFTWTGSLVSLATSNITLPAFNLPGGLHTFKAYTTAPNLQIDMNPANDTLVRTFTIIANASGSLPPFAEGFASLSFAPPGWSLENSSGLWSRNTAVGGFGLSTSCARADFYSIANADDAIISPIIDFTTVSPPIKIYFDVAHAPYSLQYVDTLVVDVFTDCGGAGPRIYSKWYTALGTAPPTTSPFVPLASQWRTDTINLDTLAGQGPMRFRFRAITGWGNYLYLDNINLYGSNVGISTLYSESGIYVFPNPAINSLNVEIRTNPGEELQVVLSDLFGKEIQHRREIAGGNEHRMIFDISMLHSGIYLVNVHTGTTDHSEKLVIIR